MLLLRVCVLLLLVLSFLFSDLMIRVVGLGFVNTRHIFLFISLFIIIVLCCFYRVIYLLVWANINTFDVFHLNQTTRSICLSADVQIRAVITPSQKSATNTHILVHSCFEPSQPLEIISGLKETFHKEIYS